MSSNIPKSCAAQDAARRRTVGWWSGRCCDVFCRKLRDAPHPLLHDARRLLGPDLDDPAKFCARIGEDAVGAAMLRLAASADASLDACSQPGEVRHVLAEAARAARDVTAGGRVHHSRLLGACGIMRSYTALFGEEELMTRADLLVLRHYTSQVIHSSFSSDIADALVAAYVAATYLADTLERRAPSPAHGLRRAS
jgi:hypothetical protein